MCKINILLVDDTDSKALALAAMLRPLNQNLVTVNSGNEALRALLQQDFALILMDVQMPLMDGFETAALIRQREKSAYVPIIFITAADKSETYASRGYALGAVDFIYTPVVPEILRAKVLVFVELKLQAESLRHAAEARAALAEELSRANLELEQSHRRLKETQTHLIQTEKMSSLGQLVAGIAHEINNPLAFVLNHLFIIESALGKIAPEAEPHLSEAARQRFRKVRARVAEMKEGLDRVKDLVLNLRTFSRLDEHNFKTVDIGASIDSVLLLLQHKANGRIRVEKRYTDSGDLYCSGGRINQVLMNLISNAVDAMPGEGQLTITTGRTAEHFVIAVRDTGSGIPEPIRGRLFDPFFTTKPVGQGTGLGLAIAYGIVQDHQGSIEVRSQEGAGSEFIVSIPLDLQARRGE